ncbi:uncharacterized protein LOC127244850 [Andrographis paniculata]|uniref:uncharacterized protein LOC127244850 n=1 Tax=Andrographis paniculata TaxID=175694 RepID=UPI0021E78CEF|nr:uncharacterized protein LOC127244850 [Andrographis paniculata]XP_051121347.1 uncharacterized protein LOC127244850 [Andrographis paniculata]
MRLKAITCSHHAFLAFVPYFPSLHVSSSCLRKCHSAATLSVAVSNHFVSSTLFKTRSLNRISRGDRIRRSCSSNLDDIEELAFQVEGFDNGGGTDEVHCATSKMSPFAGKNELGQDPFLQSRPDFLEPMMIGIRPDFPDWPDQETAMWASIEQKAKSFDIPLSLRMIKKKLQWEEAGFVDGKEESPYCSMKAAFASMVYIVVELQSHALHMREALCRENLEIISSKVQKDIHSSFVWLFQQVFSKTPDLMLHVMILLANFIVHSSLRNIDAVAEALPLKGFSDRISKDAETGDFLQSSRDSSSFGGNRLESVDEMNLWNSMLKSVKDEVLERDVFQHFVAPVSVELEPDNYEDYLRTDLLYQLTLSREPNNSLLLCNYAQFLYLVARDYDRAEECFKRAMQILPPEAESLNQYASFLWTVRRDFSGAEERFLQALSVEPENSYYASRYANFLWSTGGEETCFPLNNSLETSA